MDNYEYNGMTDHNETVRTGETAKAAEADRIQSFKKLAIPSLLYSLVFTFCMYKNWSGITAPVWIAALIAFVAYLLISSGKSLKKGSIFICSVMMIISVSCFCTRNETVLFFNYAAEFLLLVTLVLHNYADDEHWDIGKLFGEIIVSVFGSAGKVFTPFTDGKAFFDLRHGEKKSKAGLIIIGVLIAIPTIIVLGVLLASADAVFESIFSRLFEEIIKWQNILSILFMAAFGFFSAYCGMRYAQTEGALIRVKEVKKAEPVVAITVTSMVAVLYLIFSVVQILYLFIGRFTLPEGMTYAEYARRGFFQLLLVSVLNLVVVLILKKHIEKSRILNVLLLVICACTYIMIASSAIRMIMYIRAYSLTFDRVSVLFALVLLAVLLVGVIILVFRDDFKFRSFCVIVVSLVYIPFAFMNIDKTIASYNLRLFDGENTEYESYRDFYYISSLSTDAATAIIDYFEEKGISKQEMAGTDWYIEYCLNNGIDGKMHGIRSFNVSDFIANRKLTVPD